MGNIGICEYVIGVIHDKDIWYYVGEYDADGKKLEPHQKYSSCGRLAQKTCRKGKGTTKRS